MSIEQNPSAADQAFSRLEGIVDDPHAAAAEQREAVEKEARMAEMEDWAQRQGELAERTADLHRKTATNSVRRYSMSPDRFDKEIASTSTKAKEEGIDIDTEYVKAAHRIRPLPSGNLHVSARALGPDRMEYVARSPVNIRKPAERADSEEQAA